MLDRLLDASIVLSFDKRGYERHAREFNPDDLAIDLSGRTYVITGANSGIGFATAQALARMGANVAIICRNKERGGQALAELQKLANGSIELHTVDVSSLEQLRGFAGSWGTRPIDGLIHNAGILPHAFSRTYDGVESTVATNLVAPFALTHLLRSALKPGSRVIFVSSGGMYGAKLNVAQLFSGEDAGSFDGVKTYAHTKRALVILNEMFAQRWRDSGIRFHSMHPGWADTKGVQTALPRFRRWTQNVLRTSEQGADTVVWLAASDEPRRSLGLFWFDRKPVRTHLWPFTRETDTERAALWERLQALLR